MYWSQSPYAQKKHLVVAVVVVVEVVMVVAVKTNAAERKETAHRIHEGDTHGEDARTESKEAITGIDMNLKRKTTGVPTTTKKPHR